MSNKTEVRKNESIEDTLRRFNRDVSKTGTLKEVRKRKYYIKPSLDKKMRQRANKTKNR